jgi:methionine sulfoxide reductase heme-binding subunit
MGGGAIDRPQSSGEGERVCTRMRIEAIMQRSWFQKALKMGVGTACLLPLAILAWQALTDNLGANPIDEITDQTGTWTLRLLLITLAVTPARRLTGWNRLIQLRRLLGLFAFLYAGLHFTTYVWLDQFFTCEDIVADVIERPFITVGFASFVLLVPLAVTSTTAMIRRLGGKWWQRLHRLVYIIALGGVVHYLWLVKADRQLPLVYGALLAILLAYRLGPVVKDRFIPLLATFTLRPRLPQAPVHPATGSGRTGSRGIQGEQKKNRSR